MAQRIHLVSDERITLSELIRRCDDKLVSQGLPLWWLAEDLAALARNKTHLTSLLAENLSTRLRATHAGLTVRYSDQCQVLARRPRYYVRIAAWDVPRQRGGSLHFDERYFSYGFVHNHNFDLLTAGIYGPGYVSANWRLEMPIQHLRAGEPAKLVKTLDERLGDGEVLLYSRWHDVHMQQPPQSFSMSINVIVEDPSIPQYSFDPNREITLEHIGGAGYGLAGLISIARAMKHPELDSMVAIARHRLGDRIAENLLCE